MELLYNFFWTKTEFLSLMFALSIAKLDIIGARLGLTV